MSSRQNLLWLGTAASQALVPRMVPNSSLSCTMSWTGLAGVALSHKASQIPKWIKIQTLRGAARVGMRL